LGAALLRDGRGLDDDVVLHGVLLKLFFVMPAQAGIQAGSARGFPPARE
jgi:hypothetical protein